MKILVVEKKFVSGIIPGDGLSVLGSVDTTINGLTNLGLFTSTVQTGTPYDLFLS